MIVRNPLVAVIYSKDRRAIMNYLLFTLEISTCGKIWIFEMKHDEIDPQQRDDLDLLLKASDEALEAACGDKRLQLMAVDMNANSTFAVDEFLRRAWVDFVTDRIPRTDGHCASCGRNVEKGYVRDLRTRLIYCDTQCFPEPAMAMRVVEKRPRKVS
jgi:hypothetical protein